MQVTVHYVAQLRRAAGCATERVNVDADGTVATLLDRLSANHGDSVRTLLVGADGMPHPSLLVFVGEQPAAASQPLHDGDEVTVLTPIAGG
jgi:molybdopterin converting factor small subunit